MALCPCTLFSILKYLGRKYELFYIGQWPMLMLYFIFANVIEIGNRVKIKGYFYNHLQEKIKKKIGSQIKLALSVRPSA